LVCSKEKDKKEELQEKEYRITIIFAFFLTASDFNILRQFAVYTEILKSDK
jgi:hypothetical protein